MSPEEPDEIVLTGGGRTAVTRIGSVVHRAAGPWTPSVHLLLRHLEAVGFSGAPRVVGSGFDARGRETLTYLEGEFVHPHPWTDAALVQIGALLRSLHDATACFQPPRGAVWRDWCGRNLGSDARAFGHCDLGPWNIIARDGAPYAFIDWEVAGPVDPLVELAQACWLNVQLHNDDIAEKVGLPSAEKRASQVRLMADAYGLSAPQRAKLVDTMIDYAVHEAAEQVVGVTSDPTDATPLWAITWRTRAAAWMIHHRRLLSAALA